MEETKSEEKVFKKFYLRTAQHEYFETEEARAEYVKQFPHFSFDEKTQLFAEGSFEKLFPESPTDTYAEVALKEVKE